MERGIENLYIWQEARIFVNAIYKMMATCKDWGFKDQIQRASVSIMDNIAEGFERGGNKEFLNFLYIAKGSCGEVRSQLIRANDVGYLSSEEYNELYTECRKLSASIMNFIKEIKASEKVGAKYIT